MLVIGNFFDLGHQPRRASLGAAALRYGFACRLIPSPASRVSVRASRALRIAMPLRLRRINIYIKRRAIKRHAIKRHTA
jgi:hypothetical protein